MKPSTMHPLTICRFGTKLTRSSPDSPSARRRRLRHGRPHWVAAGDAAKAGGDTAEARIAHTKALRAKGPIDRGAVRKELAAIR